MYSYVAEFIVFVLGRKKEVVSLLNDTYGYIEDVLSIENPDWEFSRSDVFHLACDKRHDGEENLCFLLRFAPTDTGV